jgi:hypothetical protein
MFSVCDNANLIGVRAVRRVPDLGVVRLALYIDSARRLRRVGEHMAARRLKRWGRDARH